MKSFNIVEILSELDSTIEYLYDNFIFKPCDNLQISTDFIHHVNDRLYKIITNTNICKYGVSYSHNEAILKIELVLRTGEVINKEYLNPHALTFIKLNSL